MVEYLIATDGFQQGAVAQVDAGVGTTESIRIDGREPAARGGGDADADSRVL